MSIAKIYANQLHEYLVDLCSPPQNHQARLVRLERQMEEVRESLNRLKGQQSESGSLSTALNMVLTQAVLSMTRPSSIEAWIEDLGQRVAIIWRIPDLQKLPVEASNPASNEERLANLERQVGEILKQVDPIGALNLGINKAIVPCFRSSPTASLGVKDTKAYLFNIYTVGLIACAVILAFGRTFSRMLSLLIGAGCLFERRVIDQSFDMNPTSALPEWFTRLMGDTGIINQPKPVPLWQIQGFVIFYPVQNSGHFRFDGLFKASS